MRSKKAPVRTRQSERLRSLVTSSQKKNVECVTETITLSDSEEEDVPENQLPLKHALNEKEVVEKAEREPQAANCMSSLMMPTNKVPDCFRLQSLATSAIKRDVDRIIAAMTLDESGEEDDSENQMPSENNLNKKHSENSKSPLGPSQRTTWDLNLEDDKETHFVGRVGDGNMKYKGLYFDSQRKVAALTEETLKLREALHNAYKRDYELESGIYMTAKVMKKFAGVISDLIEEAGGATYELYQAPEEVATVSNTNAKRHNSGKNRKC